MKEAKDIKLEDAYNAYTALRRVAFHNQSYRDRTYGQLVYNKFGMTRVGISEQASKETHVPNLTDDHYNNCQSVGHYLATTEQDLTIDEFTQIVVEAGKTIRVTKKENRLLVKHQKDKPYGQGLDAYREAGILYTLFS